jgi:sugar diacid utilization regulator
MLVDGRCIGYLELCELGRPFTAIDSRALETAAMAVALKLVTIQHTADRSRAERDEYLADLLWGHRDPSQMEARGNELGLNLRGRFVVLRLQQAAGSDAPAPGISDNSTVTRLVERTVKGVAQVVSSTCGPCAYLLLLEITRADGVAGEEELTAALRRGEAVLHAELGTRRVLVSQACGNISDLPAASEKLRELADLLEELPRAPRLAFLRDLDLVRMISRREGLHGALHYADALLDPLVAHDRISGGALVTTLRAFVTNDAQITATAAALGVHTNTVRYRLARIRELSTVEPERLTSLLEVRLAFQAIDLYRAERPQVAEPPVAAEAVLTAT